MSKELGNMVDAAIQVLENKASQPRRICWHGGMSSRWEKPAFQSSVQSSAVVIQPDDMHLSDEGHTVAGDVSVKSQPLGLV